jgi:hypothetical protein
MIIAIIGMVGNAMVIYIFSGKTKSTGYGKKSSFFLKIHLISFEK